MINCYCFWLTSLSSIFIITLSYISSFFSSTYSVYNSISSNRMFSRLSYLLWDFLFPLSLWFFCTSLSWSGKSLSRISGFFPRCSWVYWGLFPRCSFCLFGSWGLYCWKLYYWGLWCLYPLGPWSFCSCKSSKLGISLFAGPCCSEYCPLPFCPICPPCLDCIFS